MKNTKKQKEREKGSRERERGGGDVRTNTNDHRSSIKSNLTSGTTDSTKIVLRH